jgi:4-hydroxy-tetrahydrodipicolinate synthase
MLVRGLYTPLVTPFDAAGAVDLDALEALAAELLDGGARGLVAVGSTGEPFALSDSESTAVFKVVASVCVERGAQLIVGAGTVDTRTTIERHAGLADVAGVTASLAVVPYYMRPGESAVVAHFEAVAARSPVPVLVYNVPYRTGQRLSGDALLEIAAIDGVAGMKQSAGGVDEDTMRLMAGRPDDFAVLCGDDAFILPLMALGGAGAIAASAHFATERFARLVAAGDRADAAALLPLALALFADPNPAVIKGLLWRQGRIATPDVRMPMAVASVEAVDAAERALDAALSLQA